MIDNLPKAFKELFKSNKVNQDLATAYKEVYKTENGKKVLEDILKTCKVNAPSYIMGNSDATAYNEGMRRIGLRIISLLEAEDENSISKQIKKPKK